MASAWTGGFADVTPAAAERPGREPVVFVHGLFDRVLAATGADQVDVVTHSLGGPNQGSDPGTCPAPGSVACEQATKGSAFITELNAGDPTPGASAASTWCPTRGIRPGPAGRHRVGP